MCDVRSLLWLCRITHQLLQMLTLLHAVSGALLNSAHAAVVNWHGMVWLECSFNTGSDCPWPHANDPEKWPASWGTFTQAPPTAIQNHRSHDSFQNAPYQHWQEIDMIDHLCSALQQLNVAVVAQCHCLDNDEVVVDLSCTSLSYATWCLVANLLLVIFNRCGETKMTMFFTVICWLQHCHACVRHWGHLAEEVWCNWAWMWRLSRGRCKIKSRQLRMPIAWSTVTVKAWSCATPVK